MNALEVLKIIGIVMIIIIILCMSLSLVSSLINLINAKTDNALNKYDHYMSRLDYNKELLSFIMTITHLEVENEIKTLLSLNVQYNVVNLDRDVEKVSKKIFSAIKPEIYQSKANMLTDEYLMQFITETASRKFLETIRIINDARSNH